VQRDLGARAKGTACADFGGGMQAQGVAGLAICGKRRRPNACRACDARQQQQQVQGCSSCSYTAKAAIDAGRLTRHAGVQHFACRRQSPVLNTSLHRSEGGMQARIAAAYTRVCVYTHKHTHTHTQTHTYTCRRGLQQHASCSRTCACSPEPTRTMGLASRHVSMPAASGCNILKS